MANAARTATPAPANQQPRADPTGKGMSQFFKEQGLLERELLSSVIERTSRQTPSAAQNSAVRIAVDADYFISRLLQDVSHVDPLWFLHSTVPHELTVLIKRRVDLFRRVGLEPYFVFGGIGANGDVESYMSTDDELDARDRVWDTVQNLSTPTMDLVDSAFDPVLGSDIEMYVARFMSEDLGCTVVVAPFLSWPQMVALLVEEKVQLLYGPCEMVLVDLPDMTVVFDLDLVSNAESTDDQEAQPAVCAVVNRASVLKKLFPDLSPRKAGDRLLDLGLLTASHHSISLLRVPLAMSFDDLFSELTATAPSFPNMGQLIHAKMNLDLQALTSAGLMSGRGGADRDSASRGLQLKHMKGRAFIKHCVVLSTRTHGPTHISLLLAAASNTVDSEQQDVRVPQNLCGVFGNNLPKELFFFQFVRLLSVPTMTCITQVFVRDDCPVADTKNLRDNMNLVISLRTQIVHQLVNLLCDRNSSYADRLKSISWVRWFEPVLVPLHKPQDVIQLDGWRLHDLPEGAQSSSIQLKDILSKNNCASNCVQYTTSKQHIYAIMLKSLDLLGYFTHVVPTHGAGTGGQNDPESGLCPFSSVILQELSLCSDFEYELVLLTELVRTNTLTHEQLTFITRENHNTQTASSPSLTAAQMARRLSSSSDSDPDMDTVTLCTRIAGILDVPIEHDVPSFPLR